MLEKIKAAEKPEESYATSQYFSEEFPLVHGSLSLNNTSHLVFFVIGKQCQQVTQSTMLASLHSRITERHSQSYSQAILYCWSFIWSPVLLTWK